MSWSTIKATGCMQASESQTIRDQDGSLFGRAVTGVADTNADDDYPLGHEEPPDAEAPDPEPHHWWNHDQDSGDSEAAFARWRRKRYCQVW